MKICKPSYSILYPLSDKDVISQAQLIDRVARVSHKTEGVSTEESYKKLLPFLFSQNPKHLSPFEFSLLVVHFVTDRGISHELVRHRHTAFCQSSTRYCNYSAGKFGKEISVILPSQIEPNSVAYSHWHNACVTAEDYYMNLIACKTPPEAARSVLPTCLATDLVMGTSFREWLSIFKLRCHPTAHPDVQLIMKPLHEYLHNLLPEVFPTLEAIFNDPTIPLPKLAEA